jgi:hypothetical protein
LCRRPRIAGHSNSKSFSATEFVNLQGGKQRRVRHLRANGGPGAVDGGKKRAPGRDDCAVYQTDVADSEVSAAAWESVENECY